MTNIYLSSTTILPFFINCYLYVLACEIACSSPTITTLWTRQLVSKQKLIQISILLPIQKCSLNYRFVYLLPLFSCFMLHENKYLQVILLVYTGLLSTYFPHIFLFSIVFIFCCCKITQKSRKLAGESAVPARTKAGAGSAARH
jgi:hypothetical protein